MRRVVQAGINGPQGAGASLGELPIVLMTDGNGGELSAQQLAQAITTRIIGEMLGAHDALFERGFAAMVAFKAEHGHCEVPKRHQAAGFNLRFWLANQRRAAKKSNYPADRRARLEALGVRLETAQRLSPDAAFERGFAALVAFHAEHGHCEVPRDHQAAGIDLGGWLRKQRAAAKKPNYREDRRARLEALGARLLPRQAPAPVRTKPDASDPAFTEFSAQARAFHAEHGHCDVPLEFGPLGAWCANQRLAAEQGLCAPERLEQLVELGVVQCDGPARDRLRA